MSEDAEDSRQFDQLEIQMEVSIAEDKMVQNDDTDSQSSFAVTIYRSLKSDAVDATLQQGNEDPSAPDPDSGHNAQAQTACESLQSDNNADDIDELLAPTGVYHELTAGLVIRALTVVPRQPGRAVPPSKVRSTRKHNNANSHNGYIGCSQIVHSPRTTTIVQPEPGDTTRPTATPWGSFWLSLFSCLFCFAPIGMIAMGLAVAALTTSNESSAERLARQSSGISYLSIIVGLVMIAVFVIMKL